MPFSRDLLSSGLSENYDKCLDLATYLRNKAFIGESYIISQSIINSDNDLVNINNKSKVHNIYLANAWDILKSKSIDLNEFVQAFNTCFNCYLKCDYDEHFAATLLRSCNYLIKNQEKSSKTFYEIFGKIPDRSKIANSYIIIPYLERLVDDNEIETFKDVFDHLPEKTKKLKALRPYANKMDLFKHRNIQPSRGKHLLLISNQEKLNLMKDLLDGTCENISVLNIECPDFVKDIPQQLETASGVVLYIPNYSDNDATYESLWSFTIGCSVQKFYKDKMILFREKDISIPDFLIPLFQNDPKCNEFKDAFTFIKLLLKYNMI